MSGALLSVRNLTVRHLGSGRELVRGLSFTVEPGGATILLGQSGSGKTMTCRAILGLLNRRSFSVSGDIRLGGLNLLNLSERDRKAIYGKRIALVPQNPMTALDPSVRILTQMARILKRPGETRALLRGRCESALYAAGLDDIGRVLRSRPYELSGGMLQRVIIAIALETGSELIIADEPTTAIDAVHRDLTIDELNRLRDVHRAVLMVTHDFQSARRMGGDVVVMLDGKAVERGELNSVIASPRAAYTLELLAASDLTRRDDRA